MTPHSAITMKNISGADVVIQRKKLKIRIFIVLAVLCNLSLDRSVSLPCSMGNPIGYLDFMRGVVYLEFIKLTTYK